MTYFRVQYFEDYAHLEYQYLVFCDTREQAIETADSRFYVEHSFDRKLPTIVTGPYEIKPGDILPLKGNN